MHCSVFKTWILIGTLKICLTYQKYVVYYYIYILFDFHSALAQGSDLESLNMDFINVRYILYSLDSGEKLVISWLPSVPPVRSHMKRYCFQNEWMIWAAYISRFLKNGLSHDDLIKWKHFPRYWPFARGIHRSPVNSPHNGQWRGALMFSFICA